MGRIDAVLFDFGFTLFTFRECTLEKYIDVFRRGVDLCAGLLVDEGLVPRDARLDDFKRRVRKARAAAWEESRRDNREFPTTDILGECLSAAYSGLDLPTGLLQRLGDTFHEPEFACWEPFGATRDTLEELGEEFALGVLSNHPHHAFILNCLERRGLSKYFDAIHTSAEVRFCKPAPEAFQQALENLGCAGAPERCVMVGDDANADIQGGHDVGMRTIMVRREYEFPFERPATVEPDAKIGGIAEVVRVLKSWN
ncbi:MAG: HAD family hydrolase [Promethearchaeota archaeon]